MYSACSLVGAIKANICSFDGHSLLGFGQAFNGEIFIYSYNGGKSDHFRLNVPTNRGKAVTKVKMVVAEGVKLLFVYPMPGWTYTTEKNAEGNIVSITYKGRMEAGEFTACAQS